MYRQATSGSYALINVLLLSHYLRITEDNLPIFNSNSHADNFKGDH
jgi:hypothetical protein